MSPLGFHPGQLLAQTLRGVAPACPVEGGEPDIADARRSVAPAPVQPGHRHQVTETCRLLRIGRWSVDCARHGRIPVDELSYPAVCPKQGSR